MFEEDSLSRKLNCEHVIMKHLPFSNHSTRRELCDLFRLPCLSKAGRASCWVMLNTDAMQKEYQAVHSKRIALGRNCQKRLFAAQLLSQGLWIKLSCN